jgi:AraC-like DNA-binding protein
LRREAYPAPAFTPDTGGDFRISARAVKVHDSVIVDARIESLVGVNKAASVHGDDQVLLHVVRRNAWTFARQRDGELTVPAGSFILQRSGPPTFEVARSTAATVLILPACALGAPIRDRLVAGSAASAEMRLLMAHVQLVEQAVRDPTPGGLQAACNALVELVDGVVRQQADGTEPALRLALARAARDLANRRLADPDLSPSLLARELSVSVRTLHRAFTADGESVGGYIRRRRLERARLALLARPAAGRMSRNSPPTGSSPTAAISSGPSRPSTARRGPNSPASPAPWSSGSGGHPYGHHAGCIEHGSAAPFSECRRQGGDDREDSSIWAL